MDGWSPSEKGVDIYRMKGVLAVQGMDNRFVFQGVHMIFNGNPAQAWGSDPRVNKIVFIGKKLNRVELEEGLKACRAQDQKAQIRGGVRVSNQQVQARQNMQHQNECHQYCASGTRRCFKTVAKKYNGQNYCKSCWKRYVDLQDPSVDVFPKD